MIFKRKNHWEEVYAKKMPTEVSWYQTEPTISLEFIASIGLDRASKIIDVGGGASVLVDRLIDQGFQNLTILDISQRSYNYATERLGKLAERVCWIEADVTEFDPPQKYDLWHDRAVFHFLTDTQERKKYVQNMNKALNPGGHVIISTFAIDGPPKCSGLNVERYSPEKLKSEFGNTFELIKSIDEAHLTPGNIYQKFIYCYFKKLNEYEEQKCC
jgi:2-polyprenyl-3-methyl-5-hydroxy-6-metoxy-1,4-benzoquinol methylase